MISIVLTAFNRAPQLALTLRSIREQAMGSTAEIVVVDDGVDDDHTPWVCHAFHVEHYVKLSRPASVEYRNAARPLNVGLRHATGDVVILQNAECMHVGDVIQPLVHHVTQHNVVFATCIALDREGKEEQVYCGTANPRPYFFCGAMLRAHFLRLRGFDEDYLGYGYEDDDFADRLKREGIRPVFLNDVTVQHQWHEPAGAIDMSVNRALFERKHLEPVVRNTEREWGAL